MGKILKICFLILAVAISVSISRQTGAREDLIGKEGFNFSLKDVDGNDVSLQDFKGKVVLLDFWAVWCGPCQMSLPFLQYLAEKYEEKGVVIVGLHVNDRVPPPEDVKVYLEGLGIKYPNLFSNSNVDNAYQIYAMPTTYILDREGMVQQCIIGFNPGSSPGKIEAGLSKVISGN